MNKKKVKVVSIEDRIPKLKQERKKKANRRLVFYLSIFFILISIIVYLQSPLSNVKKIAVSGNVYITKDEMIEQSQLTNQTNIWMIDNKKIEKMIEENPIVESVDVKRKLPSTVTIQVVENKHVGYIEEDNTIYPVFGNGTVLPIPAKSRGNSPLLHHFSDEDQLINMVTELEKVPQNILNLISEIHWVPKEENKNKIMLYMNDGFIVDGTIRKFSDKIQVYPSIAAQLDPSIQGIIHIGVGAYFEEFNAKTDKDEVENETED